MSPDLWVAIAAQLLAILGGGVHLVQRIARLERDVHWIRERLTTMSATH